jgi:predicted metal-dependent phosphotriesterase family hydrolase
LTLSAVEQHVVVSASLGGAPAPEVGSSVNVISRQDIDVVDIAVPNALHAPIAIAAADAGKMVLSHDAACFNDWLPERDLPAALPRWHFLHIHNDVIPALKQQGVTDQQIETMLVENPRKIFEQQGTY